MDFFARQDAARRQTGLMLAWFGAAVILTILLVYFLPVAGWHLYRMQSAPPDVRIPPQWWHPEAFLLVCGATLLVVAGGSLFKVAQLRRGGGAGVAELLGGRPVRPETADFFEKRLRNVVEEMAIAAGVPVPPVYVLDGEPGVNAFAAGFAPADSVVAVTRGAMTGLSRDELQGVVAHEFSHILNSDMRINLNLMGFLHGLLVIGLTGRIVFGLVARSGGGRRRGKDSGQFALLLLAAGAVLMVVGFAGFFFCSLIKASISRTRERLADASAVQFTRNPRGLAGALRKIGGLSQGSRILAPGAEQASHLFFGNGLGFSLFSTHPPLAARVRWLEPGFDGRFPKVTAEDLGRELARFEGAPARKGEPSGLADLFAGPVQAAAAVAVAAAARPNNPDALLASVGAPMERHAEAARLLVGSIPEQAKEHARDPYGARMLIYLLLLDSDAEIRTKQLALVRALAEPAVAQALEEALPRLGAIRPELRLPVVDLAIPALRLLSPAQYGAFRSTVDALVEADGRVDVFEYALRRVLLCHLDPLFGGKPRRRAANYYSIRGLERETSVVLSVLARRGHASGTEAEAAFLDAAGRIGEPKAVFRFLDPEHCTWENLDAALERIDEASFRVKKWVLGAALACLMHDHGITVEEVELFRAIADPLGCPVPPWVAPT